MAATGTKLGHSTGQGIPVGDPEFFVQRVADSAVTTERRSAPMRMSEALWGIRWEEILPRQIDYDVVVIASSFEQSLPFIEANYSRIFEEEEDARFSHPSSTDPRVRYYRTVGDFFEFKQGDRTVALLIGTAADWSTYYIRSAAALPEVQGKKLIQRFFPEMFEVLKAGGVERVEADTSPSNMATLHLLSRLRFNPSGTVLTDRWGAHIKFTRYLDDAAEQVFLDQFCTGVRYQRRKHPGLRRAGRIGERQ
ncbi:MAG: GNAT family N-acetyltransferase [Polyangiaceae bacterium]|nr:GNAT family N-acetyltransferase [Polyangiaceae bacterium]